jgi:hypothetical protein
MILFATKTFPNLIFLATGFTLASSNIRFFVDFAEAGVSIIVRTNEYLSPLLKGEHMNWADWRQKILTFGLPITASSPRFLFKFRAMVGRTTLAVAV